MGNPPAFPGDKPYPSSMVTISQVSTACIYYSQEMLSFLSPPLLHVHFKTEAASYETLPPFGAAIAMESKRVGWADHYPFMHRAEEGGGSL